ncbi:Ulp1 peptidase [Ranunculus cassubicifolius]
MTISKREVELLQPGRLINDAVVDFYIKYLQNEMRPEERSRFHFFKSSFFRELGDLDKSPSSSSEGRAALASYCKSTREVNIFEKDYVFIPVNFNLHWSLIVICHPGEIATIKDEEIDKALKVPCILHMDSDSKRGFHKGLLSYVQRYLWEEWKIHYAKTGSSDDVSSKFYNLQFLSPKVTQQENSYDCGVFLLEYVAEFLENAPISFNPRTSRFLTEDWLLVEEVSIRRQYIQMLIKLCLEY